MRSAILSAPATVSLAAAQAARASDAPGDRRLSARARSPRSSATSKRRPLTATWMMAHRRSAGPPRSQRRQQPDQAIHAPKSSRRGDSLVPRYSTRGSSTYRSCRAGWNTDRSPFAASCAEASRHKACRRLNRLRRASRRQHGQPSKLKRAAAWAKAAALSLIGYECWESSSSLVQTAPEPAEMVSSASRTSVPGVRSAVEHIAPSSP
jgi:hypothetical protein